MTTDQNSEAVEHCGHGDIWFDIDILEDDRQRVLCFDCVMEEVQELPNGWHLSIVRVGE